MHGIVLDAGVLAPYCPLDAGVPVLQTKYGQSRSGRDMLKRLWRPWPGTSESWRLNPLTTKIGLIGERHSGLSYAMLSKSLQCKDITVAWFVDATMSEERLSRMYGRPFDHGILVTG